MDFFPFLRALTSTYQSFTILSNKHVRTVGLTNSQFDVIATLGGRGQLSTSELGRETLTTKGTLTGVLDRLEAKGLITRVQSPDDKRSLQISLSAEGQALFERIFQEHIAHLAPVFKDMTQEQLDDITRNLQFINKSLSSQQ
ncbi:MAG: MarR family transcriptional regulator [Alcaligenaceae bacterium]|nr:MarR family transcriptional regulator [Alcaligenaceae bacterium]